jgi:hypothetical protein
MSSSVGDELSSSAEQELDEVRDLLNDPEDSDLEDEVCQQSNSQTILLLTLLKLQTPG